MKRLNCLVGGTLIGYERFVQRYAQDLAIVGYIEAGSGGVEVVAEGMEADLQRLLLKIKQGNAQCKVEIKDVAWSEAVGGLQKFYIYSSLEGF